MTFKLYRHLSSISTRPTIPKYARRTGCYAKSVTAINSHTDPLNKTTTQIYIWAMRGTMRSACQCPHADKGRGESKHSIKGCQASPRASPGPWPVRKHCTVWAALRNSLYISFRVRTSRNKVSNSESLTSLVCTVRIQHSGTSVNETESWTAGTEVLNPQWAPHPEPSRYLTANPTPLEQSWQPCHLSMSLKPGEQGLLISGGEWQALHSPKQALCSTLSSVPLFSSPGRHWKTWDRRAGCNILSHKHFFK